MTPLDGALLSAAALAILTGEKPCSTFTLPDGEVEEVCFTNGSMSGSGWETVEGVSVAGVPEPSVWLVMVSGFLVVGAGLRASRTGPKARGTNSLARGISLQVGKGGAA